MTSKKRAEVAEFLKAAKRALLEHGLFVVKRRENLEAAARLGLTRRNQEDIVFGLTVDDYCEGPEPDDSGVGQIWVFGPVHEGQPLYIKLKLMIDGPISRLKSISFHEQRWQLSYPLRKGGGR